MTIEQRYEVIVRAAQDAIARHGYKFGVAVHVPDHPQFITALGAALLGLQRYRTLTATTA